MAIENANDHPLKVSIVQGEEIFANSHPYKVTIEGGGGGGGGEARVVDTLPEQGESGYIYLVLKEHTQEGDVYDEWIWALQQDGTTYGWEHLGVTNELKVGGAKILTADDYNWNSTTRSAVEPFDCIALWLLDSGTYSIPDGVTAYAYANLERLQPFSNGLIIISSDETYDNHAVVSMLSLHYSNTYPGHVSGQTFTPHIYSVNKTNGEGRHAILLNESSVRDDLISTGATVPLSANQGRVLDEKIGNISTVLQTLTTGSGV